MRIPAPLRFAPLALFAASCGSAPTIPEGEGEGLLRHDRTAPEGANVYEAPTWTVGDEFVFVSGDWLEMSFRVTEITDERITLLEEANGIRQYLDPQLGDLGQALEGTPEATRVNAPADPLLHFPLWAGKTWAADVDKKSMNGETLSQTIEYRCETEELIETPFGELLCLRIWRVTRNNAEDAFGERTAVYWYSPEIGWIVRRLDNGVLLELREAHRQ